MTKMFHDRKLLRPTLVVIVVVALAAWFGLVHPFRPSSASAANHCTRFAPTPVYVDSNCTLRGNIFGGGLYSTPSTAQRDADIMATDLTRRLQVWYEEYGPSGDSIGTFIQVGGLSGYHKAWCKIATGYGDSNGYCKTNWHD